MIARHAPHRVASAVAVSAFILCLCGLSGCVLGMTKDTDFTVEQQYYCPRVKIPGSNGVFPSGTNYYEGKSPNAKLYLGNDRWIIWFKKSTSTSMRERFGIDLSGASIKNWELEEEYMQSSLDTLAQQDMVPTPHLGLVHNGDNTNVLQVTNPSDDSHMRLDHLDWALTSAIVPFAQFTYHDPTIDALPWNTLISSPTVFTPGETRTYSLPSGNPPLGTYRYVRALTDTVGGGQASDLVLVLPPVTTSGGGGSPVPITDPWAIAGAFGLITGIGAWSLHRRSRQGWAA